jgi:3-oxoacyl-[acyl-carrier protein] reductase
MDLGLAGRLVTVTGAGAGIGEAVALELATEGAALLLGSRSQERLDAVARRATAAGADPVATVVADLSTVDGVAALADAARSAAMPLHGLVACVGSTPLGTFDDVDDAVWQQAFSMKFLATVRVLRAALELMRGSGGGRIVVVAGNASRDAPPSMVTSAAMNSALSGLVASTGRTLAAEGIGLVGVHPGPTRTARYDSLVADRARRLGADASHGEKSIREQIPAGRPAEAAEVASAIAYLLSPRAAHIAATTVTIDGAQTWG